MLLYIAPRPSGAVLFLRWDRGCASCLPILPTRQSRGAACGGACWAFVCLLYGCSGWYGQRPVRAPTRVRPTVEHYYPGPLSGAGLGLSGAARAAAGPCVTQGLANGGALLMPGTGARHLAGGQPPIGRALHDFGCPDGASEFSARFEEHHCIFRPATAWQAPGTCIGFANPYPLAKLVSRHHITRSEFASCQR